jgi:hypothetical protein
MNRAFGGLSPAFNSVPDLLGRLTYRHDSLELNRCGPRCGSSSSAPPPVTKPIQGPQNR